MYKNILTSLFVFPFSYAEDYLFWALKKIEVKIDLEFYEWGYVTNRCRFTNQTAKFLLNFVQCSLLQRMIMKFDKRGQLFFHL